MLDRASLRLITVTSSSAHEPCEDPLREHRVEERASWVMHAALTASAAMLVASQCVGTHWLRGVAFVGGVLGAAGAAVVHWQRRESGCRVDREERVIVWWSGVQPAQERRIAVDAIRTVRIERATGVERLSLEDADGEPIALPVECVPPHARRWADGLAQTFPHITVTPTR